MAEYGSCESTLAPHHAKTHSLAHYYVSLPRNWQNIAQVRDHAGRCRSSAASRGAENPLSVQRAAGQRARMASRGTAPLKRAVAGNGIARGGIARGGVTQARRRTVCSRTGRSRTGRHRAGRSHPSAAPHGATSWKLHRLESYAVRRRRATSMTTDAKPTKSAPIR